ncbi:TPA: hypothetical protein N2C61_003488 [Pseudomonas aeruginosa]|jgi:hypothetical protein|uniref:hypothetical protein n=1 Tax=Pseudomonas aeruginosa TaxID=287 RepID=UPI0022DD1990|nr:hypothetical protein [Pseudomonas aeruginosa]WBM10931.1 hypothetical protein M1V28_31495 [Pseudomonas aeruginosa]HCL4132381.1 hypothetical protein [Pseudomonas aeruginosa]
MSQWQFMGNRPEGWLEELAADKARRRRKQQLRFALFATAGVLIMSAAWLAFT